MKEMYYDAAIIGAGVVGCAIARELSRYKLKLCVLEREEDVCSGTSKANSAIIHAGYDAVPGSLKAKFNVEGNRMMGELSQSLDFPFIQNGSLVLCFSQEDMPSLKALYEKGIKNGVEGLRLLTGDEVRAMEKNVTETVVAALYAPTGGIVCPFGLTLALGENAFENGAEFFFLRQVEEIKKEAGGYLLKTDKEKFHTACVINAAGVHADELHNMVSENKLKIIPRKGDYILLDKEAGNHTEHTVFQLPGKFGKGVLVTPTVHGNLLAGPTAADTEDKENTKTTAEGIKDIMQKASRGVKDIPFGAVITSFCGLRAHEEGDDFIIGEVSDAKGFFDAAGIESPGLTSAPAIGAYLAELAAKRLMAEKKENFKEERRGIIDPRKLSKKERAALIKENPRYGNMICRCEEVSEGEIADAIKRPLGAVSLDGIKRRVQAGMGRCQAGFCGPKTMEILAEETGIKLEEVCKNRPGSELLTGRR